ACWTASTPDAARRGSTTHRRPTPTNADEHRMLTFDVDAACVVHRPGTPEDQNRLAQVPFLQEVSMSQPTAGSSSRIAGSPPDGTRGSLRARFLPLVGAIALMATSAIGPGFLTQTATFTQQLGAAFSFGILISVLLDLAIQMNVW